MARQGFGISRKLLTVCLAFGLPIAVMFVLMTKAKLAEVDFARKEFVGDAYQRPLESALQHVSRHRRMWTRNLHGDTAALEAMRSEEVAMAEALARLVTVDRAHGQELQFTEQGLGLRNRKEYTVATLTQKWRRLVQERESASPSEVQKQYSAIVLHLRTMITHAGDASNLILDPDLDSYYLMDVTLLALPQMEERVQQVGVDVEELAGRPIVSEDRVRLATVAAFLAEADWSRAEASTNTSINEDQNFHGSSPSLKSELAPRLHATAALSKAVVESLRTMAASDRRKAIDATGFRDQVEALESALYALHQTALNEEDRLLEIRIADFERSLYLGFVLAGLSVLGSALLAFGLASNIVRRVRRIAAATETFAKGDMSVRVGAAGSDELGELASSFDAMTGRIGGLTNEVRAQADELRDINANLEKLVEERTSELKTRNDAFRLILDNAHDGMLTVDMHGTISSERSAMVDQWFGALPRGASFAEYIGAGNPILTAELRLGLDEMSADIMPLELTLEQLPRQTKVNGRHIRLSYQPILEDGRVTRLLVVLSDITGEIEGRQARALQEESLRIFHACQRDRSGFLDFFIDAREIVEKVSQTSAISRSHAEIARMIHTLKGNCAMFGVLSVSGLCHDIETNMAQGTSGISPADIERLKGAWTSLATTVAQIMGEDAAKKLEVADDEYAAIVEAIATGVPRRDILKAIARWKLEPAERRLGRLAENARSVARRLGKEVEVTVEANDVRVDAQTWGPVWSALSHVIRNAVDHGIERGDERVASGKAAVGRIALRTRVAGDRALIEISDDGRGVAWDRVAAKAKAASMPASTRRDLVNAIFADGISTKDVVTDMSGRGIGMAAMREACATLGGSVDIESEPARGTTVRCSFPERAMEGDVLVALITRSVTRSMTPPPQA